MRTATQVLRGFYTAAMCANGADDARYEYNRLFESATIEEMQLPAVQRRINAYLNIIAKFEKPETEPQTPNTVNAMSQQSENTPAAVEAAADAVELTTIAEGSGYINQSVALNGATIGTVEGAVCGGYWAADIYNNPVQPTPPANVYGIHSEAVAALVAHSKLPAAAPVPTDLRPLIDAAVEVFNAHAHDYGTTMATIPLAEYHRLRKLSEGMVFPDAYTLRFPSERPGVWFALMLHQNSEPHTGIMQGHNAEYVSKCPTHLAAQRARETNMWPEYI